MEIPAPSELILILLIVVLLFGSKKIPEIMGGVAEGIKTFKKALDTDDAYATLGHGQPTRPATPIEAKPVETDKGELEPKL